jgi:hypothetical protein
MSGLLLCGAKSSIISMSRVTLKREMQAMKSINTKLVLSALGIVAMLSSPAFAKQPNHQVTNADQSAVSGTNTIPGYDRDGNVVAIPNPDYR